MRVLYWTPFFLPDIGGIELLAARTLVALQRRNYEIAVVTSHGRYKVADKTEYSGIPVYRFHTRMALQEGNLRELLRIRLGVSSLKQTFKPDLVHVHFSDPSVYFHLSTANVYPTRTLVTLHTQVARYKYRGGLDSLVGQTLYMADWVTAVSAVILADAQPLVPGMKDRSSVIYSGLDAPWLIPKPLPFEPPRLLCLGRLVDAKGFDVAITAFASLLDHVPQARLIIAGDGPSRAKLERQATSLGLTEAIEFKGRVDPEEVPELMNTATIVIIPSRAEGFPLVALEAAQMARPVVAGRVGGLSEAIVHGQTGLLVEPEDSQALAEGIAFLLNHPDIATQMGQAARTRAVNVFSLTRCIDAYDTLYRRLIKEVTHTCATTKC